MYRLIRRLHSRACSKTKSSACIRRSRKIRQRNSTSFTEEKQRNYLNMSPAGSIAPHRAQSLHSPVSATPHLRSNIQPGETVLDLGSGAGLDAIIAAWKTGDAGNVIGVDLNPAMCLKSQANAAATGAKMECREGAMENIPAADASVDVVISNGVINLSFRKRRVVEEIFRVLKPGGRISITDIVSAKQLSQSIVNDPKLWAS